MRNLLQKIFFFSEDKKSKERIRYQDHIYNIRKKMEIFFNCSSGLLRRIFLTPNVTLTKYGTRFRYSSTTKKLSKLEGYNPRPLNPDDFRIQKATMQHFDLCFDFMDKYFYPREQLNRGFHIEESGLITFRKNKMKERILAGVSTFATYKPTNQVVAAIFGKILTRENSCGFSKEEIAGLSEEIKNLIQLLMYMEEKSKLFEDPKTEKVLELAVGAIHPDFSGNRLFYRLGELTESLGINLGCQLSTGQATTAATQHMSNKMGFQELFQLDYETLEINGKRVMDMDVLNGTKSVIVYKKELIN